ncbi:helix-turn-helix domain-containing protein [Rhizobium sp. BE258]|uniref:MarR family transcriptional regulator n=1 Tax=Rhizobium sp. BE258 TaxID=2817722 RepID=UPI0028675034|nr:helix-turn-helix domain-containing protein [Rhizobium sp. BE258]MDR7145558.1 DNA-binding MarR family transcriptional regulator [Rhizobium sp. BE258]
MDEKQAARNTDLRAALKLMETFRHLRSDMPMQTASAFLLIGLNPGISQGELLRKLGTSQASVSRSVLALGEVDRHGKPGLDLIRQVAQDGRLSVLYLNFSGEALLMKLLGAGRTDPAR